MNPFFSRHHNSHQMNQMNQMNNQQMMDHHDGNLSDKDMYSNSMHPGHNQMVNTRFTPSTILQIFYQI